MTFLLFVLILSCIQDLGQSTAEKIECGDIKISQSQESTATVACTRVFNSLMRCAIYCCEKEYCVSFNYHSDTYSCEIILFTPSPDSIVAADEHTYFVVMTSRSDPRNCRQDIQGLDYMGNIATTVTGKTCQHWTSMSPHSHSYTNASSFPDTSTTDLVNFCRNPTLWHEGPWCYTMDPGSRWEICDIPYCLC